MSIKDKLAAAKLPEKTVALCLRGDLQAAFEQAERELAEAQREISDSLAGGTAAREAAERIEALREQMAEATEQFTVRAMPRPQWRAFIAEHPPRRDDEGRVDERDRAVGVNMETFYDALVRECVVAPELDEDDWAQLGVVLTSRQFDDLADAAWGINRREVDVPFSRAASRILRSTEPE